MWDSFETLTLKKKKILQPPPQKKTFPSHENIFVTVYAELIDSSLWLALSNQN